MQFKRHLMQWHSWKMKSYPNITTAITILTSFLKWDWILELRYGPLMDQSSLPGQATAFNVDIAAKMMSECKTPEIKIGD